MLSTGLKFHICYAIATKINTYCCVYFMIYVTSSYLVERYMLFCGIAIYNTIKIILLNLCHTHADG